MIDPLRRQASPTGPSPPAADPKAALRQQLFTARASLDAAWRAAAAAAIVDAVRALPEVASAQHALGYAAFGTEANIDELLRAWLADGVTTHLPFVDGDDLQIAPVTDLADLEPGWRGVREPGAAHRRPVDPASLDVAVVPGVGFDPAGHRLGYGGGHFDRLLARLSPQATIVGVAYSAQLVATLPTEEHDVAVDIVVTESGPHRVGTA